MKVDIMLDASAPDFKEQLLEALGVKEGDSITFCTPQFERTDGVTITYFPRTFEEFNALKKLPHATLMKLGLGLWEEGHYLYPKEWYWNIPTGYEVLSINGEVEKFVPGKTDDDMRVGMLAYGFRLED